MNELPLSAAAGNVETPGPANREPVTTEETSGSTLTARRVDWGQVAVYLALIALSVYVLVDTSRYPPSIVAGAPGPALFPRVLAVGLLVLNVILLATTSRQPAVRREAANAGGLKRTAIAILLMIGFLVLSARADFFVLVFVMLAAVMVVAGERRTHMILLVPALFDVFMYVVFYRAFGVPFPTNLF